MGVKLALSEITADQHAQPRASMQMDTIAEYADDMQRGDTFPPCTVFFDGKKHWLADGFHRFYAAPSVGLTEIACDVRPGTKDDAIWFSCGANQTHGFRRTNEDKRRAVMRLLTHPKFKHRKQVEIANQCGVVESFITKIIKELQTENFTVKSKDEDRDDEVSKTISQPDPRLDGPSIAKSLHEIERHIGMMPSAPAAAQALPEDQRYLFPLEKLDDMAAWMTNFAKACRRRAKSLIAAE